MLKNCIIIVRGFYTIQAMEHRLHLKTWGGKEISKFGGDREKKLIQIKQYFDAWNTKPIFAYYVDSEGV